LIIAIIAGVFGFGSIAAAATDIARLLFVVFLIPEAHRRPVAMNTRRGEMRCWKASICAIAATGVLAGSAVLLEMRSAADDIADPRAPAREHPAHGTRFSVEVIESFNAKYAGDTPGHIGRGGGLSLHPHVALGDPVYHKIGDMDKAIGSLTGVVWERLRGSLTIEFRPHEDHRIAVGDEVWVDLNPADQKPPPTAEGSPASGSLR